MTRGEAINWIINISADIGKAEHNDLWHYAQALCEIREMLEGEPERKTGRWIEDAESYYRAVNEKGGGVNEDTPYFTDDIACSECLAMFSVIDNCTEAFNYCPNCGAKMEDNNGE